VGEQGSGTVGDYKLERNEARVLGKRSVFQFSTQAQRLNKLICRPLFHVSRETLSTII
jgi:hypothetical protein